MEKNVFSKLRIAESMSGLWDPLSDEQRQYLLDNMEIKIFQKNEKLYEENDAPVYLMCLISGKVKVYKSGSAGRTQIVRMVDKMGMFGYRAAFADEDYMTGASAFEESVICRIPVAVVKRLISENVEIAIFFIRQLACMLGDADLLTVDLTQKTIRARIAGQILAMKNKFGVEDDGATLNLTVSREDIANMTSMTTNNAIRTLSSLASDGIITLEGRKITIVDEEKLIRISRRG